MTRSDRHERQLDVVTCDFAVVRGHPQPFGVSLLAEGVNFAVFSRHATAISLVLFRPGELNPMLELPFDPSINRTGDVWHIGLQGLAPGFEYGYRVAGDPDDTSPVHRFDASKVVLDPYAKAISGPSLWRTGQLARPAGRRLL